MRDQDTVDAALELEARLAAGRHRSPREPRTGPLGRFLRRLAGRLMATRTAATGTGPHRPLIEAQWPGRCAYAACQCPPEHPVHGSEGLRLARQGKQGRR